MQFICYNRCVTCNKAKAWLNAQKIAYTFRDIRLDRPSESEIRKWHKASGLPLKSFFNTSGQPYKTLELKSKLASMSDDEQYALLATDGLLVKRPVLVGENFVLVGFKQEEWEVRLK